MAQIQPLLKPFHPIINWGNPITQQLRADLPFYEGSGKLLNNLGNLGVQANGVLSGTTIPSWVNTPNSPGLSFDGTSGYVSLGLMGSMGTDIANGISANFLIKTTSTALGEWGFVHTTQSSGFIIGFNEGPINTNTSGSIEVDFEDSAGTTHKIRGHTTASTGFNDGRVHSVTVTVNVNSKTIAVYVDGVSYAITYENQDTLTNYANFNASWDIGARYFNGSIGNFFASTVINFRMWSRTLTPTEARSLYTNPWQIYVKPNYNPFYVPSPAIVGTVVKMQAMRGWSFPI